MPEDTQPWSEIKKLRQEIKWAIELLDYYGALKTFYDPYDHEDVILNLAGRISCWLNPKNEGGWKVGNPEVKRLIEGEFNDE